MTGWAGDWKEWEKMIDFGPKRDKAVLRVNPGAEWRTVPGDGLEARKSCT